MNTHTFHVHGSRPKRQATGEKQLDAEGKLRKMGPPWPFPFAQDGERSRKRGRGLTQASLPLREARPTPEQEAQSTEMRNGPSFRPPNPSG